MLRTSSELSSNTRGNSYAKGNCAHCHEQHGSIDGSEPTLGSGNWNIVSGGGMINNSTNPAADIVMLNKGLTNKLFDMRMRVALVAAGSIIGVGALLVGAILSYSL